LFSVRLIDFPLNTLLLYKQLLRPVRKQTGDSHAICKTGAHHQHVPSRARKLKTLQQKSTSKNIFRKQTLTTVFNCKKHEKSLQKRKKNWSWSFENRQNKALRLYHPCANQASQVPNSKYTKKTRKAHISWKYFAL
jgi:hypothetical protein